MPRSASPAPGLLWPFTGRDAELQAVTAALDRDHAVVVAGAAGLGKSRLARELVARVAHGDTVAIVPASASSREIPLGAFAPWLSDAPYPGTEGGRDAAETGSDPGHPARPDPEPDSVPGAMASALARVESALRDAGPRTVLLVDDAHNLDTVSATLVHQLALAQAVRLVITVRTGEACPEAVTAVWKDGLAERIDIEPLDHDASAALLGAVLGAPVEAQALRRLHDVTRGNVLWLRHLVDGERAAGRLAAVDGRWEWQGTAGLSPALEQLLDERIGVLDEGERHVLELVALGEPVGLTLLIGLVSEPDVERVAERGLITVVVDGARSEVHLAHPLYGEVTRARLSLPRARRLRGELSRALRSTGSRRAGDDLRRAVLDLDSDSPPDATLLLLAAEQAMNLSDFTLAERLLHAAIDAGGGFDARLALGFLLAWLMRPAEAEVVLAAASAEAATDAERARATLARAHVLVFILDRGDDGRALLAREGVDASGAPFPDTDAVLATLRVSAGEVGPGVAAASAVLARPGLSSQATTWACWAAAYGMAYLGGDGSRVRDLVARGMEAARRAPETMAMLGNLGFADILDAGLSGTLDDARPRLEWVAGLPGEHGATWSALYQGRLALESGRVATAARLLESILPTFPGHGGGWTAWFHAMIAQARAAAGDTAGAAASIAAAQRARHPEIRLADHEIELARAWLAAAGGSVPEAVVTAVQLADDARARGQRALEVVARHTAVRFDDRGQATPLADLACALGSPRARMAAAHAAALESRDPEALLAVADDLERHELLLAAADAAGQAAVAARERGRLPAATAAASRALALAADRCEGATTPALALARAPLPVSSREREVATLAAEGLSNRQIAARLHVSVRTVESHIYRACARLGLPDRAALAAAVAPGGTQAPGNGSPRPPGPPG